MIQETYPPATPRHYGPIGLSTHDRPDLIDPAWSALITLKYDPHDYMLMGFTSTGAVARFKHRNTRKYSNVRIGGAT